MSKVGIKDIAAETGVSIATVSNALRNPGRVSDETRRKPPLQIAFTFLLTFLNL